MNGEVEICQDEKSNYVRKTPLLGGTVREVLDRWERLERRSLGLSVIQATVESIVYQMIPGAGLAISMEGVGIRCASPIERSAFETALQLGQVQIAAVHHMTKSQLILHYATGIPLEGSGVSRSEQC